MRPAIVEKLNAHLRSEMDSEQKVVYLLVELRKLLEIDSKKDKRPVLNFYCNWAVHTKLSASAIADTIIRLFDQTFEVERIDRESQTVYPPDELRELLSQSSFRNQLQESLEFYGLSADLCTSQSHWLKFSDNLCRVIEDCPLLIQRDRSKPPTKFVESVSVRRIPMEYDGDIGMEWHFEFHTNPLLHFKAGTITEIKGMPKLRK